MCSLTVSLGSFLSVMFALSSSFGLVCMCFCGEYKSSRRPMSRGGMQRYVSEKQHLFSVNKTNKNGNPLLLLTNSDKRKREGEGRQGWGCSVVGGARAHTRTSLAPLVRAALSAPREIRLPSCKASN